MSRCLRNIKRPISSDLRRTISGVVYGNSKIFYNDELKIFRPFENTVKLKFNPSTSVHETDGYLEQPVRTITEELSKHGKINGQFICDRGYTGYFNFSNAQEKQDALNSYSISPTTQFTMEDYKIGQSSDKHEIRPFRYLLVASLRPSIHSVSRIVRYLGQLNVNNGFELVQCPCDPDRMFMYFSYADGRSLLHPALCSENNCGSIGGNEVSRDYKELGRDRRNDVFLFPFADHNITIYKPQVLVFSQTANSDQITEFLSRKYGAVRRIEQTQKNEQGLYYNVYFKDKYSVYKILYEKSFYGRVMETIPNTSDQIYISQIFPHKKAWILNSLRVDGAPNLSDEDVLSYWSSFLDDIWCNPGIVSVARKREQEQDVYELYFANPWHTFDVHNRIVCNSKDGVSHGLNSRIYAGWNDGVNFYESVKHYLT